MLKLKLGGKSETVLLEDAEGNELKYEIREYSGALRDEYLTTQLAKLDVDEKGEVKKVKDYTGLYSQLLSKCVYTAEGKRVPESKIQDWPDSVQKALFEVARTICGLDKSEEEQDPKKD
jgi:hypothetical protein